MRPNLGTTLPEHEACAYAASPGVFALSGELHSSIGLLMCAHSERLASATRSAVSDDVGAGESEREGSASGLLLDSFVRFCEWERVSRNAGDGARVGAVGRRCGVVCGVPLRDGRGVAAGVGGREKPRPRFEGRRSGESWIDGRFLGRGPRKVLHSVQEQEMFSLKRGVASILSVSGR